VLALALSGCASSNGAVELADSQCNAMPALSQPNPFGNGATGAKCEKASDCAATCCTCSMNTNSKFLASECVNGSCAAAATACSDEEHLTAGSIAPVCPK
jgi:hypothetical protein